MIDTENIDNEAGNSTSTDKGTNSGRQQAFSDGDPATCSNVDTQNNQGVEYESKIKYKSTDSNESETKYKSTDSNNSDIVSAPVAKHICGGTTRLRWHVVHCCGGIRLRGCQPQNHENPVDNATNEVICGQGHGCDARRGANRARAVGNRLRNPVANWEKRERGDTINLQEFPFNETEGCNCQMNNNSTCLDFLELYLTDEMIELTLTETNRHAGQYLDSNLKNTYLDEWQLVTNPEIKTFIGIVLLMGIIYKLQLPMYWSTDTLYNTPIFSEMINRNRFYLILKFFHFNNNEDTNYNPNDENRDRLHKVHPFIDLMRTQFSETYYPGKNLKVLIKEVYSIKEVYISNTLSEQKEPDLVQSYMNYVQIME